MFRSLPPVGNPIALKPSEQPETVFQEVFGDRSVFLYGSGTMALAAALKAAKAIAQERQEISSPEVLMPAYACPDLVSAALYAGLRPVLVDLQTKTPWMDLEILKAKLNPNTVAVIAVHFLGIPERLKAIRTVLEGSMALLVEDSAQLFPNEFPIQPESGVWEGDLIVLSFGRGKPVSMLGGGAVLCRSSSLIQHLPMAAEAALQVEDRSSQLSISYTAKVRLYNALLSPMVYGLLQYVPFLKLGETIFKPLQGIALFDRGKINLLAANIAVYLTRPREAEESLKEILQEIGDEYLTDLTGVMVEGQSPALLRFPILAENPTLRDKLAQGFLRNGLGVSQMYPSPLPEISGLENKFNSEEEFPEALLFSQCLLTLPCHSGIRESDILNMERLFEKTVET